MRRCTYVALLMTLLATSAQAQTQPDWSRVEAETLQHFQALLRLDTSSPPGNETRAVDYLKGVLEQEGIPVQILASEPTRANLVARIKGNGTKRPLLIMGHTDVVTVDESKWTFPPFGAVRDGGYIYGRGTLDDKDNLVAALMVTLLLKRLNLPLDRDVIFLAEAGEEGGGMGINFMVEQNFSAIDAEFCYAEGGGVRRVGGQARYAGIGTLEKHARTVELTARGTAGHASVPLDDNAIGALAAAVAAVSTWQAPLRLNPTTTAYFDRLASISSPADAARYRSVITPASPAAKAAFDYFRKNEPAHASMLHTSVSPTMIDGGYRVNVIPSEAKATLDVRMVPDEDTEEFLATIRRVVNNPSIDVSYGQRLERPRSTTSARLDSEPFKIIESAIAKHYQSITIPTMGTGGTDMSQLRAKGIQCFGVGPAVDIEDGPKGFGAHSDQERILESELHRFVQFHWDIVRELAASK